MKKLLIVVLAGVFPFAAFGASKKNTASADVEVVESGNHAAAAMDTDRGDGCGIGWDIVNKRTFLATTTRATTNAFVPPTFGMTSGTLHCDKHPLSKAEAAGAAFALNNFDSLKIEMAQGNGEYLNGFARTMGCNDASAAAFGSMTQKNYKSLSGSESAMKLFRSVQQEIKKDATLAAGCRVSA